MRAVARKRFPKKGEGNSFLSRPLSLIAEDDFGPQYGAAITYVVELLHNLSLGGQAQIVQEATDVAKLAELLIHPCSNIRIEAVKLFSVLLQVSASYKAIQDVEF